MHTHDERRAAMLSHGGGAREVEPPTSLSSYGTRGRGGTQAAPVHDHRGRVIGSVKDGVFVKTVDGRKHQLRYPPAWAFDAASLQEAISKGAKSIHVKDTASNREFWTSMAWFRQQAFRLNRGHGEQYALPLEYWDTDGGYGAQLVLFPFDNTN